MDGKKAYMFLKVGTLVGEVFDIHEFDQKNLAGCKGLFFYENATLTNNMYSN